MIVKCEHAQADDENRMSVLEKQPMYLSYLQRCHLLFSWFEVAGVQAAAEKSPDSSCLQR